jgi:hypothetical protein
MKTRILAATTAAALSLAAAGAWAQDSMNMGFNMLTGALYNALAAEGIDTANINELSLAEIAQIRNLLDEEGMGASQRQQIENILENAGS